MPHTSSTCTSVAIVFRHGARGFTASSRDALLKYGLTQQKQGVASHACEEWQRAAELEHLTSIGQEQMKILGRWFAASHVNRVAPALKTVAHSLKWRSSVVPRVVESGKCFVSGAAPELPHCSLPEEPLPYAADALADVVFRNWHVDPQFVSATQFMKTSDEFQRAAVHVRPQLDSLYSALVGAPYGRAVAGPPPPAPAAQQQDEDADDRCDGVPLSQRLFHTTYIKELLDCELYWPSTSLALANGMLDAASPAVHTPSAAVAPFADPVKAQLLSRLSREDDAVLMRSANWVWDQRFFSHTAVRNLGSRIGGALLSELLNDAASGSVPLAMYSAHDYTLLALLSALKLGKHPTNCVGFGSFLLVELWQEGAGEGAPATTHGSRAALHPSLVARGKHRGKSVTIRLCADPFPRERAKEGHPLEFTPTLTTIAEGVSLDSLLHLAASWSPVSSGDRAGSSAQ